MTDKTSREMSPDEAQEILHDAEMKTAAAAGRVLKTAWWFEVAWLAIIAGMVFSAIAPRPFDALLLVGLAVALGALLGIHQKHYGVSVSGYRRGKTRYIAIVLAIIIFGAIVGTQALYRHFELFWIVPAGAAMAVGTGIVFHRLWAAAYRSETGS